MTSSRSPSSSNQAAMLLSPPQMRRSGLRVSQRPPTACKECSQRKVRCDKQTPCGRCVRLARPCTREVVRISKSLSQHREELSFLWSLRRRLLSKRPHGGTQDVCREAVADVDARIRLLEYGKGVAESGRLPDGDGDGDDDGDADGNDDDGHNRGSTGETMARNSVTVTVNELPPVYDSAVPAAVLATVPSAPSAGLSLAEQRMQSGESGDSNAATNTKASILTGFEFLAWGRHSQTCYPHRRCSCYEHRRYSELVSINCDTAWVGRQAMALHVDADMLLPPAVAAKVIQFHMDHLHWHHNAIHGPTFLDRCQQFWHTGTVDHPLWLALYFAVCSVSLWTLLNNELHRVALCGGDGSDEDGAVGTVSGFVCDEALVRRQFQAMVNTLYSENFVENLSLYSVQAIVISTRIAHNLDRSDLNAIFVGAAVRIAHCLGLHKISDPPDPESGAPFSWHERVEIETGKRVWLQLVIQDHFQIPYTDTYIIHPSQYITPPPKNCSDGDMVERPNDVATNSSYVRMLRRTAALIPPLLDGLGPMDARKPPHEAYQHILACDRIMRANVAQIPEFLLRETPSMAAVSSFANMQQPPPPPPWLPLARRTLAISAAEKIIMIHRPVLFDSFQSAAFRQTRATCVAAATTILREHEQAVAEQAISIWTHSAFCVTAAVVLGLELFHRPDHTDAAAHVQRQMMARAAERLRRRRCDAIAQRGALLIDTLLAAEEDLVLRMMRTSRTATATASAAAHQQAIINDMLLGSHEIVARFLAVASPAASAATTGHCSLRGPSMAGLSPSTPGLSSPSRVNAGSGMASLAMARQTAPLTAVPDSEMGALLASMDVDMDLATLDAGQDFESWFNNVFAPVYDPML